MPARTTRRLPNAVGERGAVAVEFALVLPLLLIFLLGAITAGVSYSNGIGLTNAVREGARFGATTASGGTWASDVITRTGQLQYDDPDGQSRVCARLIKNGAVLEGTCLGNGALGAVDAQQPALPTAEPDKCIVAVWGGRPFRISTGIFEPIEGVMVRSSVARYEGTAC